MKRCSEHLLFAAQVIEGYEKACKKALEILPDLVCCSAKNLRDVEEVASLLHTSVMSKQYGNEQFLAKLIAQACGKWAGIGVGTQLKNLVGLLVVLISSGKIESMFSLAGWIGWKALPLK